jgi:GAF domain-containing protein
LKGVISNDVTKEPDFLPNPLLPDTRSEMATPIMVGNTLLGVFDVQGNVVDRFTDEDIAIKTTLSRQVAVALQNLRNFAKAQKQADREAMLNTINQKIQSATSVEAVLQIAARELGHALGAPMTIAQLSMKDKSS